ncbi:MAG: hypothetical protein PVJ39_18280 [Gammaproteobacteria bacterium]|jgi:hypothetical protein
MAVRLKTKWHRSKRSERNRRGSSRPKKLEDLSSVIAINIWKLAKEAFTHMEKEGFRFREDEQAIGFMSEFIIYQLHIADRMIYGLVEEEERKAFINATAQYLTQSVIENQTDLLGPGDYGKPFIDLMNDRLANYAECGFADGEPGYDFTRYLARNVADIMQATDEKWVVEQIMDVEAPNIVEKITSVVTDVLGLRQRQQQNQNPPE